MSDDSPSMSPAVPGRSRWAFAGAIVAVLAVGVIFEAPRVAAVWSYRVIPPEIRSAEGRPILPDSPTPEPHVYLPDPDDYTRLYRARAIADGAVRRWCHMREVNAPDGVLMHWTLPMDYLAGGAGWLGRQLFRDTVGAFETGAALLPVVLGCVYLVLLALISSRLAGPAAGVLCALLAAVSPPFHRVFEFGHIDHHCLLEVLLAASLLGLLIRRDDGSGKTRGAPRLGGLLSGAAMGLAVWTAVQAFGFWLLISLVLLVAARARSQSVENRIRFSAWMLGSAGVIVLAVLLDCPAGIWRTEVDRLNAAHALVALIALSFLGLAVSGYPKPAAAASGRLIARIGAFGGLIGLAILAFLRWDALFSYLAPAEVARWHAHVAELQPLFSRALATENGQSASYWLRATRLHETLGGTIYLLPVAIVAFLRMRNAPWFARCIFAIMAAGIAVLSVFQVRWVDHYCTFVLLVLVAGIWHCSAWVARRISRSRQEVVSTAICAATLAASTIGFTTFSRLWLVMRANAAIKSDPETRLPQTRELTAALSPRMDQRRTDFVARAIDLHERRSPSTRPHRNILCEEGDGPTLLYETGLPVVAAPYHRAIGGITAVMRFFAERDPAVARTMLDDLHVRYVVVPSRVNEQLMNFESIAFGELRSFDPPDQWLDADGRLRQRLRYRNEVVQTMAYRLAIQPLNHGIPGVRLLYGICDDPKRPEAVNGLLFLVE